MTQIDDLRLTIDEDPPWRDDGRSDRRACEAERGRTIENPKSKIQNLLAAFCVMVMTSSAIAQDAKPPMHSPERVPQELEGVGITEHRNETVPLDLPFQDEHGNDVTLRHYLKDGRPIILTPVYYNCPQLCNLTLNGMVNGLNDIDMSAGKEFLIVSFSINPDEKPPLADVKKRAYLTQYTRESAKQGWHFLTGSQENIQAMCDAIGFGFRADGKGDFAHTSTIIFLTPDGVISRYMNDVQFEGRDLKFALIESSRGAIGSAMDKFLLFMCYHYDPLANSYAASAKKIMRLGGLVTLMLMATGMGILWWRGPRHDKVTRWQGDTVNETDAMNDSVTSSPCHPVTLSSNTEAVR